ncbi:hypothetical protein CUMW_017060 [Citrus unshiu]|nr:hypothetical protein CUMW_017060 [Citrus unshiu]
MATSLDSELGEQTQKGRRVLVTGFCAEAELSLVGHKVITTKSVEYMPFFLSLANFANAASDGLCISIKLDITFLRN